MSCVATRAGTRARDEQLLRTLFDEHAAALLAYALRLVDGDRGRAEDVVQETLLRAWRHPDTMAPDRGSPRPWLFAVARRLAVDAHRRRIARPHEVGDEALATVADPVDDVERALEAWLVVDALRALSAVHREVLLRTYFHCRTVSEAAHELGRSATSADDRWVPAVHVAPNRRRRQWQAPYPPYGVIEKIRRMVLGRP
jgi:RNA polymerase sigma-70 factor (ECF subfamily)